MLSFDPMVAIGYLQLAKVLVKQDKQSEARRYLQHGITHIKDNQALVQALNEL